ncbi:hypothetical protein LXL04_034542 [Taraxacum kok-saghyz]
MRLTQPVIIRYCNRLLLASHEKSHGCKRCGYGGSNRDDFGRGRGRGRGSGKSRDGNERVRDKSHVKCYKCEEYGHYSNECPKWERQEANLIEEEPALFFECEFTAFDSNNKNSADYSGFLDLSMHMPKSAGIIINTFDSLEPKPIKAIRDGLCVPDLTTPPVYYIGPLVAAAGDRSHECLNWLDSQPSQSVVYLCFGSLGLFSRDQLQEIATGLEMRGHRFLWVVRSPPSNNKEDRFLPPPKPDLNLLLPVGFLDRTKERGFVVKQWAPQVGVLNHKSVGGFVTHCEWNSVLEAVCAGVPMVAWPFYAEQRLNKAVLVEEMKLALPMNMLDGGVGGGKGGGETGKTVDGVGGRESS